MVTTAPHRRRADVVPPRALGGTVVSAEEWRAVARARGRAVYEKRMVTAEVTGNPDADVWRKYVVIQTEKGVLAYEPGAPSRAFRDVPINRSGLAKLLSYLGIREFHKTRPMEGEDAREGSPTMET